MDLTKRERLMASIVGFSLCCGLYLLGNYGAEGEFATETEVRAGGAGWRSEATIAHLELP